MRIGVMVSYQGSMEFKTWVFDDTTNEHNKYVKDWHDCVNSMVNYVNTEKEQLLTEIFLFIPRDFEFWEQTNNLKKYLRTIHQYTYLTNEIYLVIDRRIGTDYEIKEEILDKCFDELKPLCFCDIIQTDVGTNINDIGMENLKHLKSLVTISRKRKKILHQMLAEENDWKFDLHWVINKLEPFLFKVPNLLLEDEIPHNLNTVVVLEENWGKNRKPIIRFIKKRPENKLIAICTTNVDKELEDFVRVNNLDILKFAGYFDIRYFLHLYDYFLQNKVENSNPNDQLTDKDLKDYIDDDELLKDCEKLFVKKTNSKVTALITSAFDPKDFDHYNHLLNPLASQSMFDLFKDYTGEKFVIPIVTPSNLKEYLNELLPNLLVWVHFGHGSETGLQNFGGYYSNIEEWLDSFKGLGICLRLAFFFSCESARVAERFRDAGVRIAIGFEEKVLMKDCMELAKIIIPLALNGNDDGEIKQVFEERCKSLGQDYFERCKPQIFFLNE